jgi:hypothetical protein
MTGIKRMSVFEGRERPLGSCLLIGTTVMAENHRYDYTQLSYQAFNLFSVFKKEAIAS